MNAIQCRMARAALHITIHQVAKLADIAPSTISRLEAGEELKPRTIGAVRNVYEAQGIEFIDGEIFGLVLHPKRTPRRRR